MAFFDYQGKAIFYERENNDKPVLVLLNGIMMSTRSWQPFVGPLSEHFDLIRVDFFDQGQSAKLDYAYTQKLQVDMLAALFEHLNLKALHLVGISYGASVALQYALAYPDCLLTLAVFNGVAQTSPWLKTVGDGWNAVARTRDGEAFYNITIPYIYSHSFYQRSLAWMEERKKVLVEIFSDPAFCDAMIRLTESAQTHDVLDRLSHISVPTLVVASQNDVLTPPFEQQKIADNLPHATLEVYPDTGHASMYEQPEKFVQSILGFCTYSHQKISI
jgi:pimeloyl-ACP methyl ester carboxylesterase